MSKFEKNMEEIFDIAPIEDNKVTDIVPVEAKKPNEVQPDLTHAYDKSRENIEEFIEQGKGALEEILEIAKQGQHPRAFEVYGTLLKNLVDANKELLNIQKQMREMDGKKQESSSTNIDKAIFVGTTAELSKLLKGK